MNAKTVDERSAESAESAAPLKRRGLLLGAGAAGAAVLAAQVLPEAVAPAVVLTPAAPPAVAAAAGYQATAHVLRYYETARS